MLKTKSKDRNGKKGNNGEISYCSQRKAIYKGKEPQSFAISVANHPTKEVKLSDSQELTKSQEEPPIIIKSDVEVVKECNKNVIKDQVEEIIIKAEEKKFSGEEKDLEDYAKELGFTQTNTATEEIKIVSSNNFLESEDNSEGSREEKKKSKPEFPESPIIKNEEVKTHVLLHGVKSYFSAPYQELNIQDKKELVFPDKRISYSHAGIKKPLGFSRQGDLSEVAEVLCSKCNKMIIASYVGIQK